MIVSDSPSFFLGSPSACTCNVYQALPPPPEGPGYEARSPCAKKKQKKLVFASLV